MKKISFLLVIAFLLSGCVTYKFQHGAGPYDKGYVVSRDGGTIPDYTIGKNNSVPSDLALAKRRFKARHDKVEYYYRKMGLLESRAKELLWDPPVLVVKLLTGFLRLPSVAYTNYKYEHDPKYKAEVDKQDQEKDALERQRVNALKEELNAYIQKELEKEAAFTPVAQEGLADKKVTVSAVSQPAEPAKIETPANEPVKIETPAIEPAKVETLEPIKENTPEPKKEEGIKAVITARPVKGYSPLKVKFSANQSRSKYGRIISWSWDFGDGDVSDKPAPVNIYWSATYGTRPFRVALTIKDIKGNTATQTAVIEVLNK